MSDEALQTVEKREAKGKGENKGERERYTHLTAEFQRIAKRGKKAFFSEQCKGIEENNRMGKTKDLLKKNWRYQGNISCKAGHKKGQKCKYLTKAEEIKKRYEYKEELYKKGLNDLENHNAVITHLEPDILQCEVKWALGSTTTNRASGGDEILAELFQILKDDAMKVLHSTCQEIWKTQQ